MGNNSTSSISAGTDDISDRVIEKLITADAFSILPASSEGLFVNYMGQSVYKLSPSTLDYAGKIGKADSLLNRQSHHAGIKHYLPQTLFDEYVQSYFANNQFGELGGHMSPVSLFKRIAKPQHKTDGWLAHLSDRFEFRPAKEAFKQWAASDSHRAFAKVEFEFAAEFLERFPEMLVAIGAFQDCYITFLAKLKNRIQERYETDEKMKSCFNKDYALEVIDTITNIVRRNRNTYDVLLVGIARQYFLNHGGTYEHIGIGQYTEERYKSIPPDWKPPTIQDCMEGIACAIDAGAFRRKVLVKKQQEKGLPKIYDEKDKAPLLQKALAKFIYATGMFGLAEPFFDSLSIQCPASPHLVHTMAQRLEGEEKKEPRRAGAFFYDAYTHIAAYGKKHPQEFSNLLERVQKNFNEVVQSPLLRKGGSACFNKK